MAVNAPNAERSTTDAEQIRLALGEARARTLALVAHLDDRQLGASHSPIMSPLAWDLGHIAAYEDLWLAHRHGGRELLRGDLAAVYDAFETPRAVRAQAAALDPPAARDYMQAVRERTEQTIAERGIGDGFVFEMVIRHELQHGETMRQTLAIAGLLPRGEPSLEPCQQPPAWIDLPAGDFAMGAQDGGFAYDNERPRHTARTGAFQIARNPVSNGEWMRFSEREGYDRRELWSPEGWAWKTEHDARPHPAIAAGHPAAPACHLSWYEADAYARAHGARLPSETEWERAATISAEASQGAGATREQGSELAGVGAVWEWTASPFGPYPGFVAYPYREYSEVFFGNGYRVLRGGSWATAPRVASVRFRNWDLPQRRQIFAGVRLARDPR